MESRHYKLAGEIAKVRLCLEVSSAFLLNTNLRAQILKEHHHKMAEEIVKVHFCLEVSSALLLNTNLSVQMWKGTTINWLRK